MTDATQSFWDAPYALPVDTTAAIEIGPLRLWLERREHEWRAIAARHDPLAEPASAVHLPAPTAAPANGHATRYAAPPEHSHFTLKPRLADRPVVVRPDTPLRILPGCDVDVLVSTPVWVAVFLSSQASEGRALRRPVTALGSDELELFELPVVRPSDTWFGPNTLEGELAYISKTSARLAFNELPLRAGRAVTRIRVRNRTLEPMTIERVLLPAPELQLYVDPASNIWTQAVDVELKGNGVADIRYLPGPPLHAPTAVPIGQPRRIEHKHLLVRALSAFWS